MESFKDGLGGYFFIYIYSFLQIYLLLSYSAAIISIDSLSTSRLLASNILSLGLEQNRHSVNVQQVSILACELLLFFLLSKNLN